MDAANAIASKTANTNRNNVFRGEQRTNMVPPNTFRGFKVRTNVRLMF